jgi:pyruvate dehydrogenase E2 component (dihydrolipoamide acetyltransferase)
VATFVVLTNPVSSALLCPPHPKSNHPQVDIYQLSRNWADLVKRARGKQLAPDEYNSGTFTISNLGMFGVDTFDAILPPGAAWG